MDRSRGRIPAIEGLRLAAVLSILLYHSGTRFWQGGFLGVELFFVVSGFLCARSWLREDEAFGRVDAENFCIRKILRLYPAMLLVLGAFLLFGTFALPAESATGMRAEAVWAVLGAADVVRAADADPMHWFGQLWFVSLDLKYCLLLPLFLAGAKRFFSARGAETAAAGRERPAGENPEPWTAGAFRAAVALALAVWIWRIALTAAGAAPCRIYNGPDSRADAFLAGAALALAAAVPGLRAKLDAFSAPRATAAGAAALVFFAAGGFSARWDASSNFLWVSALATAVSVLFTASLAFGEGGFWNRILAHRGIAGAGGLTYDLYLWHFPLYGAIGASGVGGRWGLALCVPLSFLLSLVSSATAGRASSRLARKFRR